MDYNARFYRPYQYQMQQPDTIVPGLEAMSLNHYMYAFGNPINFNNPSGHIPCEGGIGCKGGKSNYHSNEQYLEDVYDVLLKGDWSVDNKIEIAKVVEMIDDMFRRYQNDFKKGMGSPLTFTWVIGNNQDYWKDIGLKMKIYPKAPLRG